MKDAELLEKLSAAATPGSWNPAPKRLTIPLADGSVAQGPLMSYLVGNIASPEGMKVSLGSERVADHQFVAALVNLYRSGELRLVAPEERATAVRDAALEDAARLCEQLMAQDSSPLFRYAADHLRKMKLTVVSSVPTLSPLPQSDESPK